MAVIEKLKVFAAKSKRVWLVMKKPSKKEFGAVAKISALGILILGVLGFLISILTGFFG